MSRCSICGKLVGYWENEEGTIIDDTDIKLLIKNGLKILKNYESKGELQKIGWIFDIEKGDVLCNEHFEQLYLAHGCKDENEYLDL